MIQQPTISRLCRLLLFALFTTLTPAQGQILDASFQPLTHCELSIQLQSVQFFCSGANACIEIEGGAPPYTITFSESTGNAAITTSDLSVCFQDLHPGQYTVLASDSQGCTGSLTIQIPVIDYLLDADVKPVSCNGGSDGKIDLHIYIDLAPLYFHWEGPDGFTADTEDISGLTAGIYNVSVTTTDDICVGIGKWEVKQPASIKIDVAVTASVCGQTDACVFVSGGSPAYHIWVFNSLPPQFVNNPFGMVSDWTGLDPDSGIPYHPTSNTSPAFCAQNVQPGIYYILVVDSHLCYAWKKVIIENAGGLQREHIVYPVNCAGTASGAVCFKIQGGAPPYTTYLNPATTPNDTGLVGDNGCFEGLAAGSYKLITLDASGCSVAEIIEIKEPAPLKAEFTITSPPCSEEVDGCLSVRGGTQPYQIFVWRWDSPLTVIPQPEFDSTGQPYLEGGQPADLGWFESPAADLLTFVRCADDIPAGYYVVLVLDHNNCYTLIRVTIPESTGLEMETGKRDVSCNGAQDGAIKLLVKGGVPPYTIVDGPQPWEQQDVNGFVFRNLGPGQYTIKVTDSEGCSGVVSVKINEPAAITTNLDFDPYGAYACVEVSGGVEPYHIRWIDLSTNEEAGVGKCVYNLAEGAYLVRVADANGCIAEDIVFIDPIPCAGGEAYVEPSVIQSGGTTYFILINYVGASIQWQFKTGFTGWINIPGANKEVYETPPLYSGTDKKVWVRAVVTCQGGQYWSTEAELLIEGNHFLPATADEATADRFLFDPEIRLAVLSQAENNHPDEHNLTVFPNPAHDFIRVQIPLEIRGTVQLSIWNAAGQKMQLLTVNADRSAIVSVDLTEMQPGLYLVRMESESRTQTQKLIIGQ